MKSARISMSACGPKANFKVRKEPFGLSLSKPLARGAKASTSSAWPFDKLRANGSGEPTVANSRSGPNADCRFLCGGSRHMRWSN
jgi:hypothetical protein